MGFVKTIKIFIQKKFGITNDRFDKIEAGQAKINEDIKRLEAGQAEIKAKIDKDIKEIKAGQAKSEAEIIGEIEIEIMGLEERI